jgi:hypothetical protein
VRSPWGIEALLPGQEGQSQKEKACSYFSKRVMDEEVWSVMQAHAGRIRYFAEELSYYLGDAARSEARQLQRYATELGQAVSATDRKAAAFRLADLCLLLRNKRFHGHPAFSGRNIRVALSAEAFLAILRSCVQQDLVDAESGEAADQRPGVTEEGGKADQDATADRPRD